MRKNRRLAAKSGGVMNSLSVRLAALILIGVVMTIFNVLEKSTCTRISAEIGRSERELRKLEDDRERESARLAAMMTPAQLDWTLRKNGMAMRLPGPEQQVKMGVNGRPLPGQLSLAKAARERGYETAQYRASARKRR